MSTTQFLILLFCFLLGVYVIYTRRKFYALSWKLPGPFALPLIGNGLSFLVKDEDLLDAILNVISKYESPFRIWFGPDFTVMIKKPAQLEKLMTTTSLNQKGPVYRFLKPIDGESLISGSGPKWKNDRKVMGHLFAKKTVECYIDIIQENTQRLAVVLEKYADGPQFNIEPVMHRCVADFINESHFGIKTDAQGGHLDEFLKHIDRLYEIAFARIVKVWLHSNWIFKRSEYNVKFEKARINVQNFFLERLQQSEQNRKNGVLGHSFLDKMLDIRDNNQDWATQEEMLHHMGTLYTASEDTITTISSFALLLFGMYPSIQEKVVAEIEEVMGNHTHLALTDLDKLTYLNMCINDILRLFPIAPYIMRTATADIALDDIVIPKGTTVAMSIMSAHRDPEQWEHPYDFYPEHFLPDKVKTRHPFAFLAFSGGPRSCLGKSYAYMTLNIILSTILKKFRIEAKGKFQDIRLKTDISVRERNRKYNIQIKLRH